MRQTGTNDTVRVQQHFGYRRLLEQVVIFSASHTEGLLQVDIRRVSSDLINLGHLGRSPNQQTER